MEQLPLFSHHLLIFELILIIYFIEFFLVSVCNGQNILLKTATHSDSCQHKQFNEEITVVCTR